MFVSNIWFVGVSIRYVFNSIKSVTGHQLCSFQLQLKIFKFPSQSESLIVIWTLLKAVVDVAVTVVDVAVIAVDVVVIVVQY